MLDLRADQAATTPGEETRIGSENAVLYPLFMDVSGRRCVVVGGGGVASRKVRGLLGAGARVVVVSPEVTPEIESMGVTVERRPYAPGDLAGAALPSVLRRGGLQVAVSTGGASPTLARGIRDALEPSFGAEWACLVERFRAARDAGLRVDSGTEEEVVRCLSRLRG